MFRSRMGAVVLFGVVALAAALGGSVAAQGPIAQNPRAQAPGVRCGFGAATASPFASATQVIEPAPMERVSDTITVRGTIRTDGPTAPLYIAVKDHSGGMIAETFVGARAGDGGGFVFAESFGLPVIQETPACIWIALPAPDAEGVQGQMLAMVPVTILPAAGPPATQLQSAPFVVGNTGPELIAAARAYVEGTGRAAVPIVDAQIVRVVKNWAAVRIFPPPGTTDPATVIMTRPDAVSAIGAECDTGWRGVTFGTGGLCINPDRATPLILCDYGLAYAGEEAERAVASLDALDGRESYRGAFAFDYPANARVFEPPLDPFAVRVQRFLSGVASSGFLYDIVVRPTVAGPGTVDTWRYTRMIAETGDLSLCPITGTYFETGENAVFQVDCVDGAALQRRFYVTPKGQQGGIALLVSVTVPPEGLNPWQPGADAAVALLLATVRLGE